LTKSTIDKNNIAEAEEKLAGFSSLINSVDEETAHRDQNASRY
jgi:hypothetical protein